LDIIVTFFLFYGNHIFAFDQLAFAHSVHNIVEIFVVTCESDIK